MASSINSFNRIWVFSDLHLSDPQSPLYRSFLTVLNEPETALDVVVFAGDIFELLVGSSLYFKQKYESFFKTVEMLYQKNVQLFYIQGNHDFHLASIFPKGSVKIVDSELVLGKIYIAHGDLVDQTDRGYLLLRKIFRSWGIQKLVELISGRTVEYIGESIARTHEQKEKDLSNDLVGVSRVRPIYRAFAEAKKSQGFDFIILGHCHDLDDLQPFYFNMGYPPVHRQFLFYSIESNSFIRRVFI